MFGGDYDAVSALLMLGANNMKPANGVAGMQPGVPQTGQQPFQIGLLPSNFNFANFSNPSFQLQQQQQQMQQQLLQSQIQQQIQQLQEQSQQIQLQMSQQITAEQLKKQGGAPATAATTAAAGDKPQELTAKIQTVPNFFNPNRQLLTPMQLQNARNRFIAAQVQIQQANPALAGQQFTLFTPEAAKTATKPATAAPKADQSLNASGTSLPGQEHSYAFPSPSPSHSESSSPAKGSDVSTTESELHAIQEIKKIVYTHRGKFAGNDKTKPISGQQILASPPTSPSQNSDDEDYMQDDDLAEKENKPRNSKPLMTAPKLTNWTGESIYENLPDVVQKELDNMLREAYYVKKECLDKLNTEFPINNEYNAKKSRLRANYTDPAVADDRVKNNMASRRSRQRKKFLNQILQNSLDYDLDENYLLYKQERWLTNIIKNLEEKFLQSTGDEAAIKKLRAKCGFPE